MQIRSLHIYEFQVNSKNNRNRRTRLLGHRSAFIAAGSVRVIGHLFPGWREKRGKIWEPSVGSASTA
jgi:hypothetical protein